MNKTPNPQALQALQAAAVTRSLNRPRHRMTPKRAPGMLEYGAERETFPYWKVQFWLPRQLAWKDVQEKVHDLAQAKAAGLAMKAQHGRARLMQVERQGRHPLPEL